MISAVCDQRHISDVPEDSLLLMASDGKGDLLCPLVTDRLSIKSLPSLSPHEFCSSR